MHRIKQLRQRHADLTNECRALVDRAVAENRDLTASDKARRDSIFAELDRLSGDIRLEEAEMDRERQTAASLPAPGSSRTVSDRSGAAGGAAFSSFGELLQAVHRAGVPDAVADQRLIRAAATGLGSGVPSDGGFLVDRPITTQLLARVYETGAIANRCFHLPIGPDRDGVKINAIDETSRATGSRWGGVQAYWTGQAAQVPASRPKFRQIEIGLKKVAALYYTTNELLEDATALDAVASQIVPLELNFAIEDAIINGVGSGQPLGILNSGAAVTVTKVGGQSADTFVYQNAVDMWARMYAPSRPNSVWLINQDVEPQLFTMSQVVGSGGVPVYLPANGASASPYSTLFGRPVIPVEYCSTLGDPGDVILADFSQYVLADKGGVKRDVSIHVRFLYDESVFRFTMRVDGQPTWRTPLTPKNGTKTLSPFVVLETR